MKVQNFRQNNSVKFGAISATPITIFVDKSGKEVHNSLFYIAAQATKSGFNIEVSRGLNKKGNDVLIFNTPQGTNKENMVLETLKELAKQNKIFSHINIVKDATAVNYMKNYDKKHAAPSWTKMFSSDV